MRRGVGTWAALALLAGGAHGQELDVRVEEVIALYREADAPPERAAQLAALAALGAIDAPEGNRVRVAGVLVEALDDESRLVCGQAIELLAQSPEREVALAALVARVRRHRREVDAFWKEQRKLREPVKGMPISPDADPEAFAARLPELLKRIQAATDHLEANRDLIELSTNFRDAFVSIRDDRSVEGLAALLEGHRADAWSAPAYDALLNIGTDASVALSVAAFEAYEKERKELEGELKQRERERPAREPKGWPGTRERWQGMERERIERGIAPLRERLATMDGDAHSHVERVQRFAAQAGLPVPPKEALPARAWVPWLREAKERLPDSLAAR